MFWWCFFDVLACGCLGLGLGLRLGCLVLCVFHERQKPSPPPTPTPTPTQTPKTTNERHQVLRVQREEISIEQYMGMLAERIKRDQVGMGVFWRMTVCA